ncbi:MAG: MarR family transcriptional regulator [Myxococcales bacterium]|nr:MarR family transcriptional regulator [Myxococcales bacterium]MCB9537125.1 MarR family transcriptional regulator [Myxococcales bacterium]
MSRRRSASTEEVEAPAAPVAADRQTRRVVQVCDASGRFIEYWGFKAIHGRVWTLVALRAAPLSQTEIATTLGVSRSLVSGAVAELVDYGLLRAVGTHRNAPYEAVMDFWPTIADVLRTREWMLLEGARVALEGAIDEAEYAQATDEPVLYDVERMRLLLALTEVGQSLLRILIGMRMPRGGERFATWLKNASGLVGKLRRLV